MSTKLCRPNGIGNALTNGKWLPSNPTVAMQLLYIMFKLINPVTLLRPYTTHYYGLIAIA